MCDSVTNLLSGNSHEVEGQALNLSLGIARSECSHDVQPGKSVVVRPMTSEVDEPLFI